MPADPNQPLVTPARAKRPPLFLAAAAFGVFTLLQYNDSNAWFWALLFASTAALTLRAALTGSAPSLTLPVAFLSLAAAIWALVAEVRNPGCMIGSDVPGPLLCAAWLIFLSRRRFRPSQDPRDT